jgi:DNA-binding transcriptional ArsR family regulator
MSWELSREHEDGEREDGTTPGAVFDVLGSERRRILLAVLRDRKGSMTVRDLAAEIATRENGGDASPDDCDRIHTTLVHAHLPKLEHAGLVRRGPNERVALAADSPVRTPRFQMLLRTAGSWDAGVEVLSDRRRREILSVLTDGADQLDLEELARRIVTEERAGSGSDDLDVDEVRVVLHHVHLPKLDGADVVDYDPERRTVVYQGLPAPYENWLKTGQIDRLPRKRGSA